MFDVFNETTLILMKFVENDIDNYKSILIKYTFIHNSIEKRRKIEEIKMKMFPTPVKTTI